MFQMYRVKHYNVVIFLSYNNKKALLKWRLFS